ncbi:MAG: prolyl oligopeptidase family serine peptidase, partial [Chloroflexota bacterium]|nr:prolyl oligopeptidase family serine peptidase [Chloroflexota bacterium]
PNMPWDGCELWTADLTAGGDLNHIHHVAGSGTESIFQPRWDAEGALFFVSDRTGWWNLYRTADLEEIEALCPMAAEFGLPQWVFGMSTYALAGSDRIVCAWSSGGVMKLGVLDVATRQLTPVDLPFSEYDSVQWTGDAALFLAAAATTPWAIVRLDLDTGEYTTLRRSTETALDRADLAVPEPLSWPAPDGAITHGFFYAPKNHAYMAPPGELPPLIVVSHGGPTGATSSAYNVRLQFWTSRGFAVLDVNYGGSTGFGRAYRERLAGQWGVVDVDDCVSGAEYLVGQGRVDGQRLIIRGSSAGGYTTLAALAFRDTFTAGASLYGIGDLEALATGTHKFESRYLEGLVGPYPAARERYVARSPIHHVDRLSCSLILLQGLEDKVVPPSQAEAMAAAVEAKGLPVELVQFADEGHGFRRAESIHRALEAELAFYRRVFGLEEPE